ncbi:MAG: PEP-CTERM/exosortase system-associated acyltransferase [Rhodospirillales bacterium]|nr:PEP-CTERM/exosortase system-associated acyltransferase [Rhodospirillales bacterium]
MCANTCKPEEYTSSRLYNSYFSSFMIVEADTAELRDICCRLRHQVYCVENAFEDSAGDGGDLESDVYDDFAVHALVLHRPTGMAAGTVRLILPGAKVDPPLPFFGAYEQPINDNDLAFPAAHTAEISRFAISKKFRQSARLSEIRAAKTSVAGTADEPTLQDVDAVTLALIRAFVGLASQNDIQFFCAMMGKALLRRVARLGIHFDRIGDDVEYHCRRQPSAINVLVMLDRVRQEREDVWQFITDSGAYTSAFSKLLAAE